MDKAVVQAMKGLEKYGPDGLVFSVAMIGTFGALAAGAPPIWSVLAGCGFCVIWLVRNYAVAHIEVRNRMADLELTARRRGLPIIRKAKPVVPPDA
ncbi:hypothetical protein [Methylobacterium sp. J-068]|jgi:hypothetical protein|uniref:hypothetical protein n=1 Tax=Methylobacterium sp. J-068 TaxID=2836649 RepID=UPI001FB92DD8|nr:hypothetical protein [Methylobacterium sp. J-068]MCJ2033295.1 hypothetical protein [Methylobacterium sp. J-068]